MKKLCTAIVAATMLLSANSFAFAFGSSSTCVLPKFFKEGAQFDHLTLVGSGDLIDAKIIEIDKKFCWAKVIRVDYPNESIWINLKFLGRIIQK